MSTERQKRILEIEKRLLEIEEKIVREQKAKFRKFNVQYQLAVACAFIIPIATTAITLVVVV